MKSAQLILLFFISFVMVGVLFTAKPAFAVTSEEITSLSEGLGSNSGMIASAAELAGADSELVKKFQLGVKYGEFAVRLKQGDYWGVAVDFVKFELEQEIDELTESASEKLLSAGAQRLVGVFTALKDAGIWLGERALDWRFNEGVEVGYRLYKENGGDPEFMGGWWGYYAKAKLRDIGDFPEWMDKFAKVYALEKQLTATPPTTIDIVATEKTIKKTAIVHFFKLKYPGIGSNVAEELADAIVNKSGKAAIKQIVEKYKNHLEKLTAAGAEGGAVSSGDICEGAKDEQKDCLAKLQELVERKNKVLSNEIEYWEYSRTATGIYPGGPGIGMPEEGSAGANNLINFKKSQERAIASAYEIQFGQEIRDITDSFTANKNAFQNLKSDFKDIPKEGDHWNTPSYRVSVNTGFGRFFNNVYNTIFHYGSFDYEDFKSGDAQKHYEEYLESEPKANAADDARANHLKAYLSRANGLVRGLTFLQNRINSLISSAESAKGVFSYGQVTIDDLKKIVSEIDELKEDIQFGERPWWSFWRQGVGGIDSASEAIKEMESDKKARESSIDQLKKDYTLAFKTYEGEEKQRELEKQKQAEEERKAAAEKEAQALQKQKAEEDAVKQERALQEAEKKAVAEQIRLEQQNRDKAFNVPFGESQKTTPSKSVPTTGATPTPTPQTKTVSPTPQPPTQTKSARPSGMTSNLPSGQGYVPNEYEEMAGFSFIAGWKADMMVSDFFWNDDGVYTVNGALDLGSKSLDDVTSVPTSGYAQDPYQPEVGHVYAIKTRDSKYGIIQIGSIEVGRQLNFFWRYQPDGSTSF
ncbi:MAG: hypothetical protein A3J00_03060 [Candidatus Niyogibacteria bacterium RIFCSPLOWO2_02_FULL_45_13]|uniref:Uncharacterized protein n=1 Tax=Candidatus Niyogibacteria bacterium RIFCSPLOWO2_02_FULL_45_13 TaxID=1801725 RepID=A0A1G2EY57_9BACT|nr:MAG: hypothetical protein A3J00_03060 [Candidatus Niyogibacteria bacterium RIFCSPLOWO2_02_FULL_45_13]